MWFQDTCDVTSFISNDSWGGGTKDVVVEYLSSIKEQSEMISLLGEKAEN